jgi:type IV pilus assembly protein PilO
MKQPSASLQSLEPLLIRLEKLTKVQRLLIFLGSIALIIGGFAYFVFMPRYEAIKNLKAEAEKLDGELRIATAKAAKLFQKQAELKKAETDFNAALKALPDKEEIPSLLASISQSGQDAGLEFLLFQPKQEVVKDFYAEIPVSISVKGGYHNVGVFFDKLSNLSRIVNIDDLKMVPDQSGTMLTTACTAVTYKFMETKPEPEKKK